MTLRPQLDRYIAMRRRLGADLSTAERTLRRFVVFADGESATFVDAGLVLRWLATLAAATPGTRATRFRVVRIFAEWLQGLDPNHQAPPRGLIPGHLQRAAPYIYDETEIVAIVDRASRLPSVYGMRGLTCSTLFGLVAATGLRISEALGLDRGDLDLDTGLLHVRLGKLGKERLLPLDRTVVDRLHSYGWERDRLLGATPEAFFVTCAGNRVGDCSARYNFALVCQQSRLRQPQLHHRHGRGPRIHDLRHTFAVRTLLAWYRSGADVAREMNKLTTWLGYDNPEHTYWYLEAVPELLELASSRVTNTGCEETSR